MQIHRMNYRTVNHMLPGDAATQAGWSMAEILALEKMANRHLKRFLEKHFKGRPNRDLVREELTGATTRFTEKLCGRICYIILYKRWRPKQ